MATQSLSQILQGHGQTFRTEEEPTPPVSAVPDVPDAVVTEQPEAAPVPAATEIDADPRLAGGPSPVLRSLASDQAEAYAEEIRMLRRRVAVLEAALRAADAALAAKDSAQENPPITPAEIAPAAPVAPSEFTPALAPAVAPISSNPSTDFADAWSDDDDLSFEEKFAARAFFADDADDQPSRRWLLEQT